MNLLLDTHILIWALNDDKRLSAKARELIMDPENTVCYSTVSLWEIAIKHAIHPDNVSFSGRELAKFCQEAGFMSLEIRDKHVFAVETLTRPENAPRHADPFDRMLVSQAKVENMVLLTHDSLIPFYEENCIMSV